MRRWPTRRESSPAAGPETGISTVARSFRDCSRAAGVPNQRSASSPASRRARLRSTCVRPSRDSSRQSAPTCAQTRRLATGTPQVQEQAVSSPPEKATDVV